MSDAVVIVYVNNIQTVTIISFIIARFLTVDEQFVSFFPTLGSILPSLVVRLYKYTLFNFSRYFSFSSIV